MGASQKFSKSEKQIVVDMYKLGGCSLIDIKERCGFNISVATIYNFLREQGVPLIRKTGTKHNLVGKVFGYLTVIEMAQTNKSTKSHSWRAICKCSNCGNEYFDVDPQSLLRGATTSCGCSKDRYTKTTGKNNKQFNGYEEISGRYWGVIKKRAENRGHEICVSLEYIWNIYLNQNKLCALSGLPINFANANKRSSETTASLDRIDSNKNYVEGNVQWVHKEVNIMKNVYNQEHFIELCRLIANNNKI